MLFFILITDKDFASIYNKYNKYAYTVSKRTIERKYNKYDFPAEEIKDILQISFVKLYFYLQKTENVDYMKSLIARITELTTINYLNKYINDSRQLVAEYYDSDDSEWTDREPTDPIDIMIDDENVNELVSIIKTLDVKYSSVLLLYHLHGLSLGDIAEISGTGYNTILSRHARGKKLLAKKLIERDAKKDENKLRQ